jgi:carbamoyltransferase
MSKIVVGLGGLLSDPACCIVKDGSLVAAVEQAKVSRQARPGSFPDEALAIALEVGQVRPAAISCVALARPFAHGSESDSQIEMRARFPEAEIVVVEHHHAHAASAYYVSGFDSASVLSVDRAGDFRSAVLFSAQHNNLTPIRELYFPDSIGDLYNRVTELLGYEARADEHKVQWMSSSTAKYSDAFSTAWTILGRIPTVRISIPIGWPKAASAPASIPRPAYLPKKS